MGFCQQFNSVLDGGCVNLGSALAKNVYSFEIINVAESCKFFLYVPRVNERIRHLEELTDGKRRSLFQETPAAQITRSWRRTSTLSRSSRRSFGIRRFQRLVAALRRLERCGNLRQWL